MHQVGRDGGDGVVVVGQGLGRRVAGVGGDDGAEAGCGERLGQRQQPDGVVGEAAHQQHRLAGAALVDGDAGAGRDDPGGLRRLHRREYAACCRGLPWACGGEQSERVDVADDDDDCPEGARQPDEVHVVLPARTILSLILAGVGLVIAINLIDAIQGVLIWSLAAIFLALAAEPPIRWAERHGRARRTATVTVYFGALAVVLGILAAVLVPVASQTTSLVDDLPRIVDRLKESSVDPRPRSALPRAERAREHPEPRTRCGRRPVRPHRHRLRAGVRGGLRLLPGAVLLDRAAAHHPRRAVAAAARDGRAGRHEDRRREPRRRALRGREPRHLGHRDGRAPDRAGAARRAVRLRARDPGRPVRSRAAGRRHHRRG